MSPLDYSFYERSVHEVARELIGCRVSHAGSCGRIVETESYHESEPACHAYVGLTRRTRVLFGPPGHCYVYRSYGIHALLNAVCEPEGVGAAVLIRALEPLEGLDLMHARRAQARADQLCSGPGKLTQALGITLADNAGSLVDGPIVISPPLATDSNPQIVTCRRVGITKAADLPWRYCDATSRCVSRPLPDAMPSKRAHTVRSVLRAR